MEKTPWTATFVYTDKEGVSRKGKGRTFCIEGQDIDLFPVGVLCGLLGRSYKALYKWEKNFAFPQALYRVTDSDQARMRMRCNRWYSRKQLLYIGALYTTYGRLQKKNRTSLPQFVAAVRKSFFTIDMPIKDRSTSAATE